jgi:hypothetical protein
VAQGWAVYQAATDAGAISAYFRLVCPDDPNGTMFPSDKQVGIRTLWANETDWQVGDGTNWDAQFFWTAGTTAVTNYHPYATYDGYIDPNLPENIANGHWFAGYDPGELSHFDNLINPVPASHAAADRGWSGVGLGQLQGVTWTNQEVKTLGGWYNSNWFNELGALGGWLPCPDPSAGNETWNVSPLDTGFWVSLLFDKAYDIIDQSAAYGTTFANWDDLPTLSAGIVTYNVGGTTPNSENALVALLTQWGSAADSHIQFIIAEAGGPAYHPGDCNNNGTVSTDDLGVMATNWNNTTGTMTWADCYFTGEGNVDVADLGILSTEWGWTGAPAGAVPEPASLALIGLGAVALIRRRR